MGIFNKFGDLLLRFFALIGGVVIGITRIPVLIRGIDTQEIKDTLSNIRKESGIDEKISNIDLSKIKSQITQPKGDKSSRTIHQESEVTHGAEISFPALDKFSSKEKEETILKLQILSGIFILLSILNVFNFLSFLIYLIFGLLVIAFTLYLLFTRVKLMYSEDFEAYRDFFLMYLAVGILLVLVGHSAALTMAFPFQILPSLSILLFAVIGVGVVYLIFRIRYHRDYTYGQVIEGGKNTAYVRVDYDICSNVKPDIYVVENNNFSVSINEWVKLELEGGLLSFNGNKPVRIIGKVSKTQ